MAVNDDILIDLIKDITHLSGKVFTSKRAHRGKCLKELLFASEALAAYLKERLK